MKVRRIDIMLKLVKPDLIYYEQYNEMMKEWREDGSRIAPWFLDKPCESLDSFFHATHICKNQILKIDFLLV